MIRTFFGVLIAFLAIQMPSTYAQKPKEYTSSDIFEAIGKLQFLGSALYVAAHPDDENTRLISYLSNHVKARTAYLSLTRGDGGQNRIGPEIRELLGVIRTQELMMARDLDGGQQFFTRANDFGYSKTPEETTRIWDKKEVLSDVVRVIRQFKPDIIINRFNHRTTRRTHGHHTASAMLSVEAFGLTGDADIYPDQLNDLSTWQARRIFFNTSWWFYGSQEAFADADKSRMAALDVGVYYPLKGKSNTEIAAESRSMHKSQGFGSVGSRGSLQEYLELIEGDMPSNKEDLFDGINTTWSRVEGGEPIGKVLGEIEAEFDFQTPSKSVEKLIRAKRMMESLGDNHWAKIKLEEIQVVIQACLGLYLEAVVDDYSAVRGDAIELALEATNRSEADVRLDFLRWPTYHSTDTAVGQNLRANEVFAMHVPLQIPNDQMYSSPYWLRQAGSLGMYHAEAEMIGQARLAPALNVTFGLSIEGEAMTFTKPIVFRTRDAVKGAVYRPFEIIPPISTHIEEDVYILADDHPRKVRVHVESKTAAVDGLVRLVSEDNWRIEPRELPFSLQAKGESNVFEFTIYPPAQARSTTIRPEVILDKNTYSQRTVEIEYDHIPVQTVVMDAQARAVKLDIKKAGYRILYVEGSGDAIPASLRQIGYTVDVVEADNLSADRLNTYDACIIGIRAYNLKDALRFKQATLMQYVEDGGTLVVQYNTSRGVKVDQIGPYPFELSRDRVTVEEAEIRILAPDHSVLNFPNTITSADFDGWVQERGLYFPNAWDDRYTAILSSNDPGEEAKDGGLLVTEYGNGHFIYTGYSWFRQLPAGVPGAFRIFANLLSIGKNSKP